MQYLQDVTLCFKILILKASTKFISTAILLHKSAISSLIMKIPWERQVKDAKSFYLYFVSLRIMYKEEGELSKEWLGVAIRHTAKS